MQVASHLLLSSDQLLNAVPLPLCITDGHQRIVASNDVLSDFLGFRPVPQTPIGEALALTDTQARQFCELDKAILAEGQERALEIKLARADGAPRQFLVRKTLMDLSQGLVMNTLQDITDTQRAQSILHEAIDSIAEAFVIYDNDGRLVICNCNFREMYQYTEEQARPGVHFQELGKIDVLQGNVAIGDEKGEDYLERKAEYRRHLKGSFTVKLRDGRWIRTTDRRLASGGFVSVQSDITHIKEAQRQLLVAKEEAERANRAKSEFLANMSHELRTPLNSITGFSQVLVSEMFGPHSVPKYREYAEIIYSAGHHLCDLITDILDQSKIELGNVELEETATDISGIFADCASLLEDRRQRAGITLKLSPCEELPLVLVDRVKIKQILLNLLTNALKFTDPGGHITAQYRVNDQGELEIQVTDNGIGIAEEDLADILEPFNQVASSKTRNHDGTGLGLSISKSYMELHGGRLTIASTPGQGTTVTATLPKERVLS